jgi:eukaryotic-like serine/threonine-protein kinase
MRSPSKTNPVRNRVWTVGRFLVLLTGLAATFGVFFLAGLRVTTRAREVRIPELRGKSASEARAALDSLGLVMRIDEARKPDRMVPADHVLDQEPGAGQTVRRQRAVRVRLSDGQREPVLPKLTDLPERTAELTLAADQVTIGYRAEVRTAAYGPNVVVAQDPAAGRRAATINLVLNRADAAQSFVTPDLIGCLAMRAADILRGQGFRVAIAAEVPYPGLPPGVVVRQTPQPGFRIQASETMTLEVSR